MFGFFNSDEFKRLANDILQRRPRRVGFFNSKEFKCLADEILRCRREAKRYSTSPTAND